MKITPMELKTIADGVVAVAQVRGVRATTVTIGGHQVELEYHEDQRDGISVWVVAIDNIVAS